MPSTQILIATLSSAVILFLTLYAVFCEKYRDNLVQRTGLVLMGLAASGVLLAVTHGGNLLNALLTMAAGTALYAVGTAYKQVRAWRSQA